MNKYVIPLCVCICILISTIYGSLWMRHVDPVQKIQIVLFWALTYPGWLYINIYYLILDNGTSNHQTSCSRVITKGNGGSFLYIKVCILCLKNCLLHIFSLKKHYAITKVYVEPIPTYKKLVSIYYIGKNNSNT